MGATQMQNNKINDKSTLKWLYNSTKKQLPAVSLLIIANGLMSFLGVIFAFKCSSVIDSAVAFDKGGLISSLVFLVTLIAIQIIMRIVCQNISVRTTAKTEITLKSQLFANILRKDYSKITAFHSGELMTRLTSDISIISDGIISLAPSVVAMVTRLIFAAAALIMVNTAFALVFLIAGLLILLATSLFRKLMKKLHKLVQETDGRLRSFLQEALGGILMIKVFGIEDKIDDTAADYQKENYKAKMKRRTISIAANTGLSLIFQLGFIFAFGWGAFGLINGVISVGTVTAIIQLVNQIQTPFAGMSGVLPRYYSILASAERIMEIEDIDSEKGEAFEKIDSVSTYNKLESIVFNNISFGYDRDIVLENTSLEIKKGDFAVISGISGIGKSTLMKLLLGVINPHSGEIYLKLKGGENRTADKSTRPLFSYVPQGNLLLSGTIREAITITNPAASDEAIRRALKVSCADKFINDFPLGLNTPIGEKGFGLSEGQIQRLAVARAILSDEPIILLDEATSALDEETEKQLLCNIRAMENRTCIIISHKKAAYDICNKEIKIEDKKIFVKEI